jgi:hypothetical protein
MKHVAILAIALAAILVTRGAFAADITSTLDGAGPSDFAVINLGGSFQLNSDSGSAYKTITGNGNVGLVSGSTASISGATTYSSGTLYVSNASGPNLAGATFADGIVTSDPRLDANGSVVTAAKNAASTFNGMKADQTFGSITGTTTISATQDGVNVIDLTRVNLSSGQSLTLNANGHSNVEFVVNVGHDIQLSGGGLLISGGISDMDVVYNVAGKIQSSGGGITTDYGILLDSGQDVAWDGVQLNGEIIGSNVSVVSGGRVYDDFAAKGGGGGTPEPGTLSLLASAGAASLLFVRRRFVRP